MEIRLANPGDDTLEISKIYAQSWKAAYKGIVPQKYLDSLPEDRWAFKLTQSAFHSMLVIEDGSYIGTSSFGAAREEEWAGWAEIISIYLLPEVFGRGIGGQLLGAVLTELSHIGYHKVYLWVLEGNARARRFYETHGFRCLGEAKDIEIGGKLLQELRYVCEIRLAL